ncbi:MAG: hypothetical protein IJ717_00495 [Treponema sp.]|nr:hypothetical protein [Treponema sp.]
MPNKMSDPNSAMMQMLMQMMQGMQPSSAIIKANPNQNAQSQMQSQMTNQMMNQYAQNQMMQNQMQNQYAQNQMQSQYAQNQQGNASPRDFVKMAPIEMNGMKGVMGFGYIDDSEMMKSPAFQNGGMKSANVDVAARGQNFEEKRNVIAPNPEQKQMAHNLAMQFMQSKNQPFTQEQMQAIEEKILERIMGATKG